MGNTYLHNPRCSKSRQGIALLEEKNVTFTIKEYLKEPLSKTELSKLYTLLKKKYSVKEFTRTKEKSFKESGLSINSIESKENWVRSVQENPILIERPILYNDKSATIGRPPEDLVK